MRALLCSCYRYLEAADEEDLRKLVLAHLREDHLEEEEEVGAADEGQARELVAACAYRLEYAAPYADGEGFDEEFGLEPY